MRNFTIDINSALMLPGKVCKKQKASLRLSLPLLALGCALALSACAEAPETRLGKARDLHLTYPMPQANGEQIPYRVYLPSTWEKGRQWPLVVVLHGYSGTANSPFDDAEGGLQKAAEKHGFVVVSPNGYNGMADYGANLPLPSGLSRYGKPLKMLPEAESALAETDVLNVIDRVLKDYNIDPGRVYLMGNSMGMTGVLHLASKIPDKWCAISSSGGPPWPDYPVERLKPLYGALFVHGEDDKTARPLDSQFLADRAKAAGVDARMHLVPGGSHATGWVDYLPETFDFFMEKDCRKR